MLKVDSFRQVANRAIAEGGQIKIRDGDSGSEPELVVSGKSGWSRFKNSLGINSDRHISINRAFGRAVRQEYGEQFFRKLPSNLRRELVDGMSFSGVIRNSKRVIESVQPYLLNHHATIDEGVRVNHTVLNNQISGEKLSVLLDKLGGRAYTQFSNTLSDQAELRGAIKHELKSYLQSDYKRDKAEVLSEKSINIAVRKVLSKKLGAQIGEQLLAIKTDNLGAFALRHLKANPIHDTSSLPVYGKRFVASDINLKFGDKYIIHDQKKLGVEPGFVALKAWTQADTQKMLSLDEATNSNHHYGIIASSVYVDFLTDRELIELAETYSSSGNVLPKNPTTADVAVAQNAPLLRQMLKADVSFRLDFLKDEFRALRNELVKGGLTKSSEGSKRFDVMREVVQQQTEKFTKRHYIKLDYHETTWTNHLRSGNKYARGERQGVGVVKAFKDRAVRWWKSDTPKHLNRSAVKEALANDLTRALGVPTQKLNIVPSRFPDGQIKLLLDGTHVTGNRPDDQYSDLTPYMSGYGERQVLVKTVIQKSQEGKTLVVPEVRVREDGRIMMQADTTRVGMGRYKAVFSLLADVDAVGSKGQNKGTLGKEFFAIDPGHSLDARSMKGEIPRNDFRIKSEGHGSYKNFSVFDQSPFSERMRGLKDTLEKVLYAQGEVTGGVFNEYRKQFGGDKKSDLNKELQFAEDINKWRNELEERALRFERAFSDRLAVYKFDMSTIADSVQDPVQRQSLINNAHDNILDTLDALEKITSKHSWTQEWSDSKGAKFGVDLVNPQVRFVDRQEWRVKEDPNDSGRLIFEMVSPNREAELRLKAFRNGVPQSANLDMAVIGGSISIQKSQIGNLSSYFGLDNLAKLDAHPRPRPDTSRSPEIGDTLPVATEVEDDFRVRERFDTVIERLGDVADGDANDAIGRERSDTTVIKRVSDAFDREADYAFFGRESSGSVSIKKVDESSDAKFDEASNEQLRSATIIERVAPKVNSLFPVITQDNLTAFLEYDAVLANIPDPVALSQKFISAGSPDPFQSVLNRRGAEALDEIARIRMIAETLGYLKANDIDQKDSDLRKMRGQYVLALVNHLGPVHNPADDGHCGFHAMAFAEKGEQRERQVSPSIEDRLQSAQLEREKLINWYDDQYNSSDVHTNNSERQKVMRAFSDQGNWQEAFAFALSGVRAAFGQDKASSDGWANEFTFRLKAIASGRPVVYIEETGAYVTKPDGGRERITLDSERLKPGGAADSLQRDVTQVGNLIKNLRRDFDSPIVVCDLGKDHYKAIDVDSI